MMHEHDPVSFLALCWDDLTQGTRQHESAECFKTLMDLYGRGRAYHTTEHLVDLMRQADRLRFHDPVAVRLAVFYHDAVYGASSRAALGLPETGSNEEHSAQLAQKHLSTMGFPPNVVERVCALVRMTELHAADPADRDAALFLDMDMSILGASPEHYAAYTVQVRMEYASVSAADFAAGRAAFLDRTLARRFFITDHYETALGEAARTNMRRERADLAALMPPPPAPAP